MSSFEESYLGQLRKLVGNRMLITPAVRVAIQDEQGAILLIRRSDNGKWGFPAGSMELDESVWDAMQREVKEETGLDVIAATPIAVYSEPRFQFTNAFGGQHQMLAFVFRVDEWCGKLLTETDETIDARFFALEELPELPPVYQETLADVAAFDGSLILK
ncbi:MAG: NUDIX domain-containing protein [Anaerolineales bacterium]|nr:NUDIX domain-containing protein [Anaerolineales bacterium]